MIFNEAVVFFMCYKACSFTNYKIVFPVLTQNPTCQNPKLKIHTEKKKKKMTSE